MTNLGAVLQDSGPGEARHWWEQAANTGDTDDTTNLLALLHDSDPHDARE